MMGMLQWWVCCCGGYVAVVGMLQWWVCCCDGYVAMVGMLLWWVCCCGGYVMVYVFDINQSNSPTPFYSILGSIFCLCGAYNGVSFHRFVSAFSLCSSGLTSALLVLSTLYLFIKVSFSPDIILCG